MIFDRALNETFVRRLAEEADSGGWWQDVLADRSLLVAPRRTALNVYWRGQALFNVSCPHGQLAVSTHEKFLVDPALAGQVPLVAGRFDTAASLERALFRSYEGLATLAKMKRAATLFSGEEKSGCHEIAVRNAGVIDVEVAFPGRLVLADGGEKTAPRIDLASVEADGDDVRLTFWEAKAYANGELRALGDGAAPVCTQIETYRLALAQHRADIEASYAAVAANLVAFKAMGWQRELSPLIEAVGRGERRLTLGAFPKVGLVVFGFDSGQRDEPRWKKHLDRLRATIGEVRAVGDPKNLRVGA
ncbi:hypothetical protein [Methylobacterium soli]|uniref:Uncharacterized protein n=1 Tax=Methylobacterium soli TaxID=553447 RepID=A0A6L3SVA1_9HYPH|nr:hypothetical protein [Methylobacterium soli]KAB1077174.1 hypothetical protein F6X53_20045 [Methylobacterium soli]GJE42179.1 hypothetical protein AEGHOMDF_1350 [Methylobacterium soli]